ncbi:hypothetical protein TNCV_535981 [Trichonephila clavipes]|nr:hypothetical protein TNCV_535981 [Trichonephila clavipes]
MGMLENLEHRDKNTQEMRRQEGFSEEMEHKQYEDGRKGRLKNAGCERSELVFVLQETSMCIERAIDECNLG